MSSPFSTEEPKQPSETTFYAILERLEIGSKWLPWICLVLIINLLTPSLFYFWAQAETVYSQTVSLPNAKIVLDRFHIVHHLSRAMNRVRIQIMNQFDRKSQEYRALKRYWKLIQQDSRKLSDKRFYRPMFRMHLTNKEILEKLLSYSDELRQYYELYQFLLFHFQEKNSDHFFSLIEQ